MGGGGGENLGGIGEALGVVASGAAFREVVQDQDGDVEVEAPTGEAAHDFAREGVVREASAFDSGVKAVDDDELGTDFDSVFENVRLLAIGVESSEPVGLGGGVVEGGHRVWVRHEEGIF